MHVGSNLPKIVESNGKVTISLRAHQMCLIAVVPILGRTF